ncbi:MlaD family protein [Pseudonocardia spinosispora]|uniref:MlaD family protein n=1 Tax=Pseudonocardia spinosispora TaxID=103441 RepID=UPI00048C9FBC|nr:MlaD family protein [Pseudonocardia spinosispora]
MARLKGSDGRVLTGLASVAVLLVVGHLALTANQGRLPGTPVTTVHAEFRNVGQLQVGSDVRQNGVVAGRVTAIRASGGTALVTMELHDGIRMYRDGRALIGDQSALAQKLVELRAGNPASGPLGDAVLPAGQTESTHDVVELLDVFDAPTRAALGSMLRQVGGLAGHGPGLHDFLATAPSDLTSVGTISTTAASPRTDLPGLLSTGARLSGRFAGHEREITELLDHTDRTLRALSTEGGAPLGAATAKLPTAVRALRGAMDDAHRPLADLVVATGELRSGARSLGQATPDVRAVLRDAVPPLRQVPDVADVAEPALADLTHTVRDARPFTARLGDGLSSAAPPLRTIQPYALDIGTMFTDLGSLVSSHDGWEYRLRILPLPPTSSSVLGDVIADSRNPYPAPGQATRDRDPDGGLVPASGR